ncbi:DUF418 domain-containing protein [Streptomyces sp. DSM 44917]|uniref:DUF418 domain-containing protein n=1 Tax=Streptomyces boetiae TaxID=3075541 RepID=A0ABU2LD84_9ACTN|nr:DUF418 domain-containing protein [Streptomyces sp. DSM 44917]MDT0309549.1 DUF418 domain-containing protein [Streptomyces sp. DSM 44917]
MTTADEARAGAPPLTTTTEPALSAGRRLPVLDVLRGVAILGTLLTNVWIFAHPAGEWGVLSDSSAMVSLNDLLRDPSPALAAEWAFRFLGNGKALGMLTLLFGVGLAIQYRSATGHGGRWPGRYPRRALFLLAEGTLHFLLIFAWDVLMGYAVTALVVAWLLARSEAARRRAMRWAAGAHVALVLLLTAALLAEDGEGGGDAGYGRAAEVYGHGGYLEVVGFRLEHALALRMEPVITFGLLLFLFLLGVRLFRAGAFGDDAAGRRLRLRLCRWGLGVGLPLNLATSLGGSDWALADRYLAAPFVAVGCVGLVGALVDRVRRPGALTAALGAVGRTALSCYVLQNALCALLCYGFGLGLAARPGTDGSPWWVMGVWAGVCAVLLIGAPLWLRRFRHGPLEAAQKRLLRR